VIKNTNDACDSVARIQKALKAKKDSETAEECKCRQFLSHIETQIEREKSVGNRTGFVNKTKLYNLGQMADRAERYINKHFGRLAQNECTKKYSLEALAECNMKSAEMVYEETTGETISND
jgi:hypothetical protein